MIRLALAVLALTATLSDAAEVFSGENPAQGPLNAGKSIRYSFHLPAQSFFCLRADALQTALHVTVRAPEGKTVAEAQAPKGLYGAYSLAGTSPAAGDYVLEISNDSPRPAAYEVRLVELRPASPNDSKRIEAEKLLNQAIDAAASVPSDQGAVAALRACDQVADERCRARAVFVAGLLYLYQNQFPKADQEMERALAFETNDDYSRAAILNWRMMVQTRLGNFSAARDTAQRAVDASEKAHSSNLLAMAYTRRTAISRSLGQDDEVISDFRHAIQIAESAGLRSVAVESQVQLASILLAYGEPGAEELLQAALATSEALKLNEHEAFALNTLVTVRRRQGDPQGALEYASRATPLYADGTDPGGQADNLLLLAAIFADLRDYNKAADYNDRALKLARSVSDRGRESAALIGYANLKARQGDSRGSVGFLREALDLCRNVTHNRLTEAEVLQAIGAQLAKLKDFTGAEENYSSALRIYEQTRDSFKQAEILGRIGALYADRGDHPAALEYYRKALDLRRRVGDKMGTVISQLTIARALRREGKPLEARSILAETQQDVESLRQRIAAPNLRMGYFGGLQPFYEEYVDLLIQLYHDAPAAGYEKTAFQVSEFAKARVLLDNFPEIPDAMTPELAKREKQLRLSIRRAAENSKAQSAATLESLLERYELLFNEIKAQNPQYGAEKSPPILTAGEAAAQLLDAHTVLLEYKVCDGKSYAWVISSEGVYVAELPGREKLRALVSRVSEARSGEETVDADRIYWAAARELSEAVIAPLAEKLKPGRLLLVTDDALQEVSFAGLPWPAAPRSQPVPLVERFSEIIYIPSASNLAAGRSLPRTGKPPKEIAIFTEPLYKPDRANLLASGPESRKIATLAPRDRVLVLSGPQANPAAVESAHLENFRHILFVTHSVIDTKHPDLSGIVLSEVDAAGKPQIGILRLIDIYRLHLRADLVFLAACEGGEGKSVPGEGLVALSRGFMYAGARSVIATLWQMHDVPTARLMGDFYRRVMGPEKWNAAAALRETQLSLWRQKRSPREWAAFVIVGDTK
jgi:CHAT domain-containing protein